MPAGKRHQSSSVLYTLVLFVGLFIISSVLAVVFYTKSEDFKDRVARLETSIDELASATERSDLGRLVGSRDSGSYLGQLLNYHDKTTQMTLGRVQETSAEVNFNLIHSEVARAVTTAQPHIKVETIDPNTGLVPIIDKLDAVLTATLLAKENLEKDLEQLQQKFDDAFARINATAATLTAEKEDIFRQNDKIASDYRELETERTRAADERVATVQQKLIAERQLSQGFNQDLLRTQAELELAHGKLSAAEEKVRKIEPVPDRAASVYEPDGKIILVDELAGVVHLNLGSDDRVYRGLTFSVYDRGSAIRKDGRAKAEVEIFGLSKNYSLARIVRSAAKNPIATEDAIANLIWDASESKTFVLIGEFDLDSDGVVEGDAPDRISSLISQWGGKVEKEVSVATDVVIVGNLPSIPPKPTFDDLEIDPLAQERYDFAQQQRTRYDRIHDSARDLMIPMFKYSKFLYLIGYTGQVQKPRAFYGSDPGWGGDSHSSL